MPSFSVISLNGKILTVDGVSFRLLTNNTSEIGASSFNSISVTPLGDDTYTIKINGITFTAAKYPDDVLLDRNGVVLRDCNSAYLTYTNTN